MIPMRIDICIPAHNEAEIIEEAVRTTVAAGRPIPGATVRHIVVDNASDDETGARARHAGAHVLRIEVKGKGAAVIAAARESQADVFAYLDADLSADPSMLSDLAVSLNDADIVIGSRLLNPAQVKRGFLRSLSSKLFHVLRKAMLGINVEDTQCGIKIMNTKGRAILAGCLEQGWFFDMEFLARAEQAGLRIIEVAVPWEEQRFSRRKSKLSLLKDGQEGVRAIWRIRNYLK